MGDIFIVAVISLLAKLIEDARKIGLATDGVKRLKDVHGLYEAFNLHVAISVSIFALLLSQKISDFPICLLILVLAGVASKGVFSQHKPERLVWADFDARWGLIVPNGCAVATIITGIYATSIKPMGLVGIPADGKSGFAEISVSLVLSMAIGICLSNLLTLLFGRILASRIDDKEKLRAYSLKLLDVLFDKARKAQLTHAENNQLRSNLMSYMMTATSSRTAKKVLTKLKPLTSSIDQGLYEETEIVYNQRFPLNPF